MTSSPKYSLDVTQHLPTNIKKYLRSNPQKSAREIARNLNATRREINSILYRDPITFTSVGTDPPLWSLNTSIAPIKEKAEIVKEPKTTQTRIQRPSIQKRNVEQYSSSDVHVIELEDLSSSIERIKTFWRISRTHLRDNPAATEVISRAWTKLNVPPRFQSRFKNFLKDNGFREDECVLEDLLELAPKFTISEIFRNLMLSISLNGYISIESIAKFASVGKLHNHPDIPYLQSLVHEPEIRRLIDDLEIVNRRAAGETLDSIAATYGLSRERVRQRVRDMSLYGIEISGIDIRKNKRNADESTKAASISNFVMRFPGCTYEEIENSFGSSNAEIRRLLKPNLKRFVAPTKRNGTSTMSNEEILRAIQTASTFEYPLSGSGFDELVESNLVKCVSRVRIMQIFGTWSNACELAGVESLQPVRLSYDRIWTETDLWEYLIDFLLSPQSSNSNGNYDSWAKEKPGDRPSVGTLRNYLGQWSEIVGIALLKLREAPYHQKFQQAIERSVNEI